MRPKPTPKKGKEADPGLCDSYNDDYGDLDDLEIDDDWDDEGSDDGDEDGYDYDEGDDDDDLL